MYADCLDKTKMLNQILFKQILLNSSNFNALNFKQFVLHIKYALKYFALQMYRCVFLIRNI